MLGFLSLVKRVIVNLFIVFSLLCVSISIHAQHTMRPSVVKLSPLQAGDVLIVSISKDTEPVLGGQISSFSSRVVVAKDGTISVPFLGKIPAAGMSIPELDRNLQARYAGYFGAESQFFKPSVPPRVTLLYLGYGQKSGLEKAIEQIGQQLRSR
jgi:hypothetical protein